MSAKTFEEWWDSDSKFDDDTVGKGGVRACCVKAWNASRAALLADRPDVAKIMVLVDDYADQLCSALRDDGGIGVADGLVAKLKKDAVRSALESLAAQLAAREEEAKRLRGHIQSYFNALDVEAKTKASADNAIDNFDDPSQELIAYEKALNEAAEAAAVLRDFPKEPTR